MLRDRGKCELACPAVPIQEIYLMQFSSQTPVVEGALSPGVMQRSADILLQRPYQHRVLSVGPSHADEVVQLELEGGRKVAHS